jgi:hypothetical protein
MTLTLNPEIERVLAEQAAKLGTTPDELAEQAVEEKYGNRQKSPIEETPDERRARIYALMGSMAHLGPSHIAEDRAEEIAREERRERK